MNKTIRANIILDLLAYGSFHARDNRVVTYSLVKTLPAALFAHVRYK